MPLLGIGTSKMPRAVAAVKSTPASILGGQWSHNTKAWMNEDVFCEWLMDAERYFRSIGKKIVMLVDNCPAHKVNRISDHLQYIRVVFLPPNITSIGQPCDAGIIQSFKSNYRKMMLRKVAQFVDDDSVVRLDTSTLKKHVNILHSLQFAKAAWESVSEATVKNCWRKAGFTSEMDMPTEANAAATDEPGDLEDDIAELEQLDAAEPCTVMPSDNVADIVNSLEPARDNAEPDADDDVTETIPEPPSTATLLIALDTVRSALYASHADASHHYNLTKIENFLATNAASRKRQSTLFEIWLK